MAGSGGDQGEPAAPEGRTAILTVDGMGRWATVTYGIGRGTEIRLEKEIRFPHSYNLRGEPIVTTPQNAYSTFARSELDLLAAGDCLVAKKVA